MKKLSGVALATLMTVAASPVFAGFSLSDVANVAAQVQGANGNGATTDKSAQAVQMLTKVNELGVKPEQAAGGIGAMLSLAKNQLTSSDYSQLAEQVPGVNKLAGAGALGQLSQLGGLLGKSSGVSETATSAVSNVANTDQLNAAFSALGMQDGMVAKFAPVLLDYFKGQNVSTSLLSKLGSAWGV